MIIENATLLAIAVPSYSAAAKATFGTPTTLRVRCQMTNVSGASRRQLGVTIDDATATMLLMKSAKVNPPPAKDQQLSIMIDGEASQNWRVVEIQNQAKNEMPYWMIFLEVIR